MNFAHDRHRKAAGRWSANPEDIDRGVNVKK